MKQCEGLHPKPKHFSNLEKIHIEIQEFPNGNYLKIMKLE